LEFPTIDTTVGWRQLSTDQSVALPANVLPNGKQKISVVFHAIINEGKVSFRKSARPPVPFVLDKVDIDLQADVLHLPGIAVIESEKDVSKAALVEASFGKPPVRIWGWDDCVAIAFHIDKPPVDLEFDVILRAAGTEWPIGSFAVSSGQRFVGRIERVLIGFAARDADVVLKPSPETALYTIDMERIWGDEVVFPHIHVKQNAFLGENER
jgi:hypothetical protein